MLKKTLSILFVFFLCFPLQAQDEEPKKEFDKFFFVLRGGVNSHSISGDETQSDLGRAYGYISQFQFNKTFGFDLSGELIDFGSKEMWNDNGQEITSRVRLKYIMQSIGANIYFSKYVNIRIGGYGAIIPSDDDIFNTTKHIEITTNADTVRYEAPDYKDLDFGGYLECHLYALRWLGISVRYTHGMHNIYQGTDNTINYKNRGLALFLNLRI